MTLMGRENHFLSRLRTTPQRDYHDMNEALVIYSPRQILPLFLAMAYPYFLLTHAGGRRTFISPSPSLDRSLARDDYGADYSLDHP